MTGGPILADPILTGVVGWPVGHSLSPLIHTIWAARANIDGYYIPIPVPAPYDDFARAMDGLKNIGFAGVNVTIPHKEHALRYCDEASVPATQAGAANMLTFSAGGAHGDNSDIAGFESAVRDSNPAFSKAASALILGAGGAARGVAIALKNIGISNLTIVNRTREKADEIAALLGLLAGNWDDRSDLLAAADIVVNATSLGMAGQPALALETQNFNPQSIIADIVYSPLETDLLKAAASRGCRTVDGLAMLMHQAAPGFRAWFGGDAIVDDALRTELMTELKRRQSP